jgi:hypothetical protein
MISGVNALYGMDAIKGTKFQTFTAFGKNGTDRKIYFFLMNGVDFQNCRVFVEALDPDKISTTLQMKEYAKKLKEYGASYKVVLLCTEGENYSKFSVSNLIKDQIPRSKLDLFVRDGDQTHPICKVNALEGVDGEDYKVTLENYAEFSRLLASQAKKIQLVSAK